MNYLIDGNEFIFNLVDSFFIPVPAQEDLTSIQSKLDVKLFPITDNPSVISGTTEIVNVPVEQTNGPAEPSS